MKSNAKRFLLGAVFAGAILQLAACATPLTADHQRLDDLQADIRTLSAQVEKISGQLQGMDRLIRPLEMRRETVDLAGAYRVGRSDARVAVVAFSDYQCPYCRTFHEETYPLLREHYVDTGKIVLAYRDLPLDFHPMAKEAAVAARCAGDQGHYWEAADLLFESQENLGVDLYREIAGKLSLDAAAYLSCLDDPAVMADVRDDAMAAGELGIQGTPTFFVGRIDGDRIVDAIPMLGAQPYAAMAQTIDSLL